MPIYKHKPAHPLYHRTPTGPTCAKCNLGGNCPGGTEAFGEGFAKPFGNMRSGIMFATEALDSVEDVKRERALAGVGGFLLARIFAKKQMKLSEEFRMVSALFCKPSMSIWRKKSESIQPWAADAIMHCAPNLDAEIALYQPKVIMALGETAFTALTGLEYPIMACRGYVFRDRKDRCWVIPTLDPSWVLRGNQVYAQIILKDVEKAQRIVREGFSYETPECLLDPAPDIWQKFVDGFLSDPTRPLALDIETPWKQDVNEDELVVEAIADPTERDESYQIDRYSFAYRKPDGTDISCSVANSEVYSMGIRALVTAASKEA